MDEQKQKLIERIRQAQNILVTVSTNPNVDQLAAAIGLTLALNKLDKHGTAVFSGQIPSTIEFLKPEQTIEKTTDGLRDFIIALDKSKADKLRYKVEDQVVRIFITPYRTTLSQNDFNFSQGDFNVDVVIALGVTEQNDLDSAITAHGRILHDATVASVTTTGQGSLGTINWVDPAASSLCEMVYNLADGLDKKSIDNQIATALLTGIVAGTERFSNERTTPKTMSVSALLMAAGANQQLIATQLATAGPAPAVIADITPMPTAVGGEASGRDPGTLDIEHNTSETPEPAAPDVAKPEASGTEGGQPQIEVDDDGQLHIAGQEPTPASAPAISQVRGTTSSDAPTESNGAVKRELITGPPQISGGDLTASASPEGLEPAAEELTLPAVQSPLLSHKEPVLAPLSAPVTPPSTTPIVPLSAAADVAPPPVPVPAPAVPPAPPIQPLSAAPSAAAPLTSPFAPSAPSSSMPSLSTDPLAPAPALDPTPAPAATPAALDDARNAVEAALNSAPSAPPQPIAALNAQPLGPELHAPDPASADPLAAPALAPTPAMPPVLNTGFSEPTPGNTPADGALDMPLPSNPFGPGMATTPPAPASAFPGAPAPGTVGPAPPPVPPPMVPTGA